MSFTKQIIRRRYNVFCNLRGIKYEIVNQYFFLIVQGIEKLVKIVKVQFSFKLPRILSVFLAFLHLQITNYYILFLRSRFLEFLVIVISCVQ